MSVIAARVYEDKIVIAADSITIRGFTQTTGVGFSKLFKENGLIVGCTGSSQEASLLKAYSKAHLIEGKDEKAIIDFMHDFAAWKSGITNEFSIENTYILVWKGKAFQVEGFFVEEIKEFETCGAGMDFALAALVLGHDPVKAVEVACECSVFCSLPVQVMEVPRNVY